jgi:hypothetical protein
MLMAILAVNSQQNHLCFNEKIVTDSPMKVPKNIGFMRNPDTLLAAFLTS